MLAYLHVSMSYTKQLLKSTVYLHGNSVCDVIIVHMISGDAQTNRPTERRGKRKAILRPAGQSIKHALTGTHWANEVPLICWFSAEQLMVVFCECW